MLWKIYTCHHWPISGDKMLPCYKSKCFSPQGNPIVGIYNILLSWVYLEPGLQAFYVVNQSHYSVIWFMIQYAHLVHDLLKTYSFSMFLTTTSWYCEWVEARGGVWGSEEGGWSDSNIFFKHKLKSLFLLGGGGWRQMSKTCI